MTLLLSVFSCVFLISSKVSKKYLIKNRNIKFILITLGYRLILKIKKMETISEQDNECTCGDCLEEHTCPYKENIEDDSTTTCDCCDYCTQQCRDNI